jgi:hypothetical protein
MKVSVNDLGKMISKFEMNLVRRNFSLLFNDLDDGVDRIFCDHFGDSWLKLTLQDEVEVKKIVNVTS